MNILENIKLMFSLKNIVVENRKLKTKISKLNMRQKTLREELFKSYIYILMLKTGLSREILCKKFIAAEKRTGCHYKEFYRYKLYEMTSAEQEKVLVQSFNKVIKEKYNEGKRWINIFPDKAKTNKLFNEYIKRVWCVNRKISFEEFRKVFSDSSRIIYKPKNGAYGRGVCVFSIDKDNIDEVYKKIINFPVGIVEEYVVQHSELLRLSPNSVNTLRIVTVSSNDFPVTKDGKHVDVAYATLRIGDGNAVVDNFHSGGMCANVDLKTGELITDASDDACNIYINHPATGVKIKGFVIPYFKEALDMVNEAIIKNNIEGYLGWDVAITNDGPLLIEINTNPGVVLLQQPYAAEKLGMKYILEKYI